MTDAPKVPDWLAAARSQWTHTGATRPDFALPPGPGQESVWDYPRPPIHVADGRLVEVHGRNGLIASTNSSVRVLETSHPPSFYLPPESIVDGSLVLTANSSHCEWKGEAQYFSEAGHREQIGWRYPSPYSEFADLANYVSFYPSLVQCTVDGEVVRAQSLSFYGGWVTDEIVGPFKGEPGSSSA